MTSNNETVYPWLLWSHMTSNNKTVFLIEHSHWLLRSHMTTNNETFYITALYHSLLWSDMKGFTHQKVKEKRKWHKKLVSSTCWIDTKEKRTLKKEPLRLNLFSYGGQFTIYNLMTGNFCFNSQLTQHHSVFSFNHYSARHMSRILRKSPFASAVIKFQIWNTFLTVPFEFQLKKKKRERTLLVKNCLKTRKRRFSFTTQAQQNPSETLWPWPELV